MIIEKGNQYSREVSGDQNRRAIKEQFEGNWSKFSGKCDSGLVLEVSILT